MHLFVGYYKGIADAGQLDYNKVKVDGRFIPNRHSSDTIKLDGGTFYYQKWCSENFNVKRFV